MNNANKDHISLETAKLLKDCGVESRWYWGIESGINNYPPRICTDLSKWDADNMVPVCSAYTWGEILWEHAERFFDGYWRATYRAGGYFDDAGLTAGLLNLLQEKKYEAADEYFRNNTILIKKS